MINVNIVQMFFDNLNYQIKRNDILGDFFFKLSNEKFFHNRIAFFIKDSDNNCKLFGYDFKLNKKFGDYFKEENNIEIIASSPLSYNFINKTIVYPLLYFKNQLSWPPADNWDEGDLINKGPMLIWNGYGSGPIYVDKEENNDYSNLIIFKYLNSKNQEIKKVYNKHAYLKWITTNNNMKDPFINKKISETSKVLLLESIKFKQNNKRPLLEIPIECST